MEAVIKILVPITICFFGLITGSYSTTGTICNGNLLEESTMCCNNAIYNATNQLGNELGCCQGKQLYDTALKLCCGNQLIQQDGDKKCCQAYNYNPSKLDRVYSEQKKEFCCEGVVNKLPPGSDLNEYTCCGKSFIKKSKNSCCRSTINQSNQSIVTLGPDDECCGASKFNTKSHYCEVNTEKVLLEGMDICSDKEYNTSSEICCETGHGASVVKIPDEHLNCTPENSCFTLQCRNDQVYNTDTVEWNQRLNRTITRGHDVCGKEEFNTNIEVCCGQYLHNQTVGYLCCGGLWINGNTHDCCNNEVFDKTRETCCGKMMKIILTPEINCCGRTSFNLTTQVCCESAHVSSHKIPITKLKANDTQCCSVNNIQEPYNEYSQECRKGVGVVKVVKDNNLPEGRKTTTESSVTKRPRNHFCKNGKKSQFKKTCNKRNSSHAYVVGVDSSRSRMVLHVLIVNPKPFRGLVAKWRLSTHSKCVKQWDKQFVWLFTNRRHKGSKNTLRITNRDMLLKDTRRNRKMRSRLCRQNS